MAADAGQARVGCFDLDAQGRHPFLGYGLGAGDLRIYHSGDCIPFDGLADLLADFAPQIALLPVNGRDSARLAAGIPGNFTLDEAVVLTSSLRYLIPHHFGMFAFNTIDEGRIDRMAMDETAGMARIFKPRAGETLRIFP